MPSSSDSPIHRYHDGTKHSFQRFARWLGYLDWASQPKPFRSFPGARVIPLYPAPGAAPGGNRGYTPTPVAFHHLTGGSIAAVPIEASAVGDLLRHALGLSAWKQIGTSRWALRVNPSSGNLHPTEAYVVCGPIFEASGSADASRHAGVFHYAPDRHALEERCQFDAGAWAGACGGQDVVLIALTSIEWREAWKYGERAFRYCQHDLGHAMAAISLSAAIMGWQAEILGAWSHRDVSLLTGSGRDEDFVDVEREEPAAVLAISAGRPPESIVRGADAVVRAVRGGSWSGHASLLSQDHVQWTFIDEIAQATQDPGRPFAALGAKPSAFDSTSSTPEPGPWALLASPPVVRDARALVLRRRSAVAFDGVSDLEADQFFAMLASVMPARTPPWPLMWWTPRIHLVVFVHRVRGLESGVYLLGRDPAGFSRLKAAIGVDMNPAHPSLPFVRVVTGDVRAIARRLSCDQDIASEGFFSLGMLADFDASLEEYGPSFYRRLFWESGVLGQVLYLQAEALGKRGTGIGCFYDNAVHDLLGLESHHFQSVYHFTVGMPIEDARLTTEPGYPWPD